MVISAADLGVLQEKSIFLIQKNKKYGIKITPDMNPIYVVLERSCPRDSKNVSYVDVGLVQTGLDLIESWAWGGWVYGVGWTQY